MLEQKFIWSLGLIYFSVYWEHSAKLQRREAEIKVSYWSRLSLSVPTRCNNSIGFFKETCKFQTMQLSANYSWQLLYNNYGSWSPWRPWYSRLKKNTGKISLFLHSSLSIWHWVPPQTRYWVEVLTTTNSKPSSNPSWNKILT